MEKIAYIKKFIKFLLTSQAIGAFFCFSLQMDGSKPQNIFLVSFTGGLILAYFFFRRVRLSYDLYKISALLYLLLVVLNIVPICFGIEWFFGLFLWNFLYAFFMVMLALTREFVPPGIQSLMRHIKAQQNSMPPVIFKVINHGLTSALFKKSGIVSIAVVVILVSMHLWTSSGKSSLPERILTSVNQQKTGPKNENSISGNSVPSIETMNSTEECAQFAKELDSYLVLLQKAYASRDHVGIARTLNSLEKHLILSETRCPDLKPFNDKIRIVKDELSAKIYSVVITKNFQSKLDDFTMARERMEDCKAVEIGREVLMMIPEMKIVNRDNERNLRNLASLEGSIRELIISSGKRCRGEYF